MLVTFQVITEAHNRWPAKGDKPSGESWNLILQDMSHPYQHRMRSMVQYRLNDEEREKYWGKLPDRQVKVAVHEVLNGEKKPVLRGELIEVIGEPGKK
ncbi:MAG TPA: hypothetical protein VGR78_00600 [Verrucomicrobiae bacterium]|nr:hypothetical protein [Verrucomicrobiae bacterium]